jgi:hypothetical protein
MYHYGGVGQIVYFVEYGARHQPADLIGRHGFELESAASHVLVHMNDC